MMIDISTFLCILLSILGYFVGRKTADTSDCTLITYTCNEPEWIKGLRYCSVTRNRNTPMWYYQESVGSYDAREYFQIDSSLPDDEIRKFYYDLMFCNFKSFKKLGVGRSFGEYYAPSKNHLNHPHKNFSRKQKETESDA